jgi:hypothetical protein
MSGTDEQGPAALSFSYQLQARDVYAATWASIAAASPIGAVYLACMGALAIPGLIFYIATGRDVTSTGAAFSGAIAFTMIVLAWAPRRSFDRMQEFEKSLAVTLSEAGVSIADGKSRTDLAWDSISTIHRTRAGVLFRTRPGGGVFVPMRSIGVADREQLSAWIAWSTSARPAENRPATGGGKGQLTLVLWVALVLAFVAIYNLLAKR